MIARKHTVRVRPALKDGKPLVVYDHLSRPIPAKGRTFIRNAVIAQLIKIGELIIVEEAEHDVTE